MAQEVEQPIIELANKAVNKVKNALNAIPIPSLKKPDTSWHDKMVAEANESFRKAAEKEAAKKKVVKKPLQSAGMTKKPTTSKPIYKKRVAGKQ
jgi:hypothetical protein